MEGDLICFDWDGTLADSMALCVAEITETLRRMGLPVPPEETLRRCNGPTLEEAAPMIGVPPERMREYLDIRLQAELSLCASTCRLFPGIRDMLERLQSHAALCVVSNGVQTYLEIAMAANGVNGLFRRVEAFRQGRTKAQALGETLAALRPRRAWMVGDRLGDLRAGQANGLPTIAAQYGFGTPAEWACADFRAATVDDLTRLLLSLTGA